MKAEILKRDPKAVIIDSEAKKNDLDWIDRIEEFDAFMDWLRIAIFIPAICNKQT